MLPVCNVNVKHVNAEEQNLLHYVAKRANRRAISVLSAYRAKVSSLTTTARDAKGRTPREVLRIRRSVLEGFAYDIERLRTIEVPRAHRKITKVD